MDGVKAFIEYADAEKAAMEAEENALSKLQTQEAALSDASNSAYKERSPFRKLKEKRNETDDDGKALRARIEEAESALDERARRLSLMRTVYDLLKRIDHEDFTKKAEERAGADLAEFAEKAKQGDFDVSLLIRAEDAVYRATEEFEASLRVHYALPDADEPDGFKETVKKMLDRKDE